MLRLSHLAFLFGCCSVVVAADPVQPIRFPEIRTSPVPGTVSKLTGELLYVIDSDVELIVLSSPDGVVRVSTDAGPLRMRGRFVDGDGSVETRNYKGKHIYTIDAIASGRTELIVIPKGVSKQSDIIRKTLDVDSGAGPRPPPKPDPEPGPKPDPEPVVKADKVWLIVVEETSQRTPTTSKVLGNSDFWLSVVTRGHSFRHWDVDSAEAKASGYGDHARKVGLPALFIVDKATDKTLKVVPLPSSVSGIEQEMKGVTK